MARRYYLVAAPNTSEPSDPVEVSEPLTKIDLAVIRLMSHGDENQDIARAMGYSVGTVRNRVALILAKLGCRNRTEAVAEALRAKIIS